MTKNLFISYRRADARWPALAIRQGISPLLSVRIFMDIESIDPGADFVEEINRSVDQCGALIAIIGPNWLKLQDRAGRRRIDNPDDFVRLEIKRALDKEARVIPLLIEDAEMPRADELPDDLARLARRNAARLNFESHTSDIQRLADALIRLGFQSGAAAPAAPLDPIDDRPPAEDGVTAMWREAEEDEKSFFFLARAEFDRGDYALSERAFASLFERSRSRDGVEALMTLRAQRWRADCMVRQGRLDEAMALLEECMAAASDRHGDEEVETLAARYSIALAVLDQGDAAQAEALLRDLLPVWEKVSGAAHPATLKTRTEIARAVLDQGDAAQAEALLRDLLPVWEKVRGAEHPDTLTTRFSIARAVLDQGDAAQAEALWRDQLPVREKVSGAEHPHTLVTRYRLAEAVLRGGRAEEAASLLAVAAKDAVTILGHKHPRRGEIACLRAEAAAALGDAAAADGFVAEAEAIWGDRLKPEHPFRRALAAFKASRGGTGQSKGDR